MSNTLKALLVEDSRTFTLLVSTLAEDKAEWTVKNNLTSARKTIEEEDFDIVILDLHLPDGDSIELCEEIRAKQQSRYTTVVFISGEESLEWRLRSYEAGADDFIIKKISAEELKLKLDAIFEYQLHRHQQSLQHKNQVKEIVANYGKKNEPFDKLLSFSRDCLGVDTLDQISGITNNFMKNWALEFSLQIKYNHNSVFRYRNDNADFSPIEEVLFEELHDQAGRVQTFGRKSYFRSGGVEIIIQNMPIEDKETFDMLKDLLHIISGIINDKVYTLDTLEYIKKSHINIINLAKEGNTDSIIESIKELQALLQPGETTLLSESNSDDTTFY